uniref:BTB domain-containing protein n=1 Tax=Panagrellus redivivus TaxID=6233 RepID=A0A7E4V3V1_PANRE
MTTATNSLVKHIAKLYLNEEFSDVTIIVGDIQISAHRVILAQRSEYFKTMLKCGLSESTTNRIELHETPFNAFKLVLEWMYTDSIDISTYDNALDVLRLAHMYQIPELVNEAAYYFESNCTDENVYSILNEAVLLSLDELANFAIQYLNNIGHLNLNCGFDNLSKDALIMVLKNLCFVPGVEIVCAVLDWMKANPSESDDFPDVLKHLDVRDITLAELEAVPSDALEIVMDVLRQRRKEKLFPSYQLPNTNVALPEHGVRVITGDTKSFFKKDGRVLKHKIGELGIHIDLGHQFKLNSIEMHLVDDHNEAYSYWIDVSLDNQNWIRVIDHSEAICRSFQELHFKSYHAQFIRIFGTASTTDVFQISKFEALYTTEPFETDSETTLLVPEYNVALIENNAIIVQGQSEPPNALINGESYGYTWNDGFTWNPLGEGIIIQLPQPYMIDSMTLLLFDKDERVYSYNIEVSVDRVNWTQVISEENVSGKRNIKFDRQPVVFVKLTGTNNSVGTTLDCVHFECFAEG